MKTDLRILKTRESLQHALLSLLKEKPLEKITVAELCRVSRINRGTFYLHYKDINGLFNEYFLEITADLKKSYYEPYYRTNFIIENLQPDMIKIFHHIKQHQRFYRIVLGKNVPLMYYYSLFDTIRDFLHESIQEEIETDERETIDLSYHASYQSNAILGLIIEWYRRDFIDEPKKLNEQLIHILSNRFNR